MKVNYKQFAKSSIFTFTKPNLTCLMVEVVSKVHIRKVKPFGVLPAIDIVVSVKKFVY